MGVRISQLHVARRTLLEWLPQAGFDVVPVTSDAIDLDATLQSCDVFVIAVAPRDTKALGLLQRARQCNPTARSLVVATRAAVLNARRAIDMGATDVFGWPGARAELVARLLELARVGRTLRIVLRSEITSSPDATATVVRSAARLADQLKLSPRERSLLPKFLLGLEHKEIAVQETIAPRTVRFHGENIRRKAAGASWPEIRARWYAEGGRP